jgi:hypothetical protein
MKGFEPSTFAMAKHTRHPEAPSFGVLGHGWNGFVVPNQAHLVPKAVPTTTRGTHVVPTV